MEKIRLDLGRAKTHKVRRAGRGRHRTRVADWKRRDNRAWLDKERRRYT